MAALPQMKSMPRRGGKEGRAAAEGHAQAKNPHTQVSPECGDFILREAVLTCGDDRRRPLRTLP